MFNEEDVSGLVAMGFKPEDITKLLGLSKEKFDELLPQRVKKPRKISVPAVPVAPAPRLITRADRGMMIVTYRTTCSICGKTTDRTEEVKKLSYKVKQDSTQDYLVKRVSANCTHCRAYLFELPKDQLVDLILGTKRTDVMPRLELNVSEQMELHLWSEIKPKPPKHYPIVLLSDQRKWQCQAVRAFISVVQSLNDTNKEA